MQRQEGWFCGWESDAGLEKSGYYSNTFPLRFWASSIGPDSENTNAPAEMCCHKGCQWAGHIRHGEKRRQQWGFELFILFILALLWNGSVNKSSAHYPLDSFSALFPKLVPLDIWIIKLSQMGLAGPYKMITRSLWYFYCSSAWRISIPVHLSTPSILYKISSFCYFLPTRSRADSEHVKFRVNISQPCTMELLILFLSVFRAKQTKLTLFWFSF